MTSNNDGRTLAGPCLRLERAFWAMYCAEFLGKAALGVCACKSRPCRTVLVLPLRDHRLLKRDGGVSTQVLRRAT